MAESHGDDTFILGDILAFIVGAAASGLSFFIAILIGTGGGHGSDATSRVARH